MNVHVKNPAMVPASNENEVRLFDFKDNGIGVVMIAGEPWFVAKDAIRVLGFSSSAGASWLVRHIGADESRPVRHSNVISGDVSFPNRGAICIPESGLYKLILRSDKPNAREFQDWVTQEVLPAIRKDGGYVLGEEKAKTGELSEDELVLRAFEILKQKIARLGTRREGS
jgi:prophage antirepressor-like protein